MECLSCHHQKGANCAGCHEEQVHFIRGETFGKKEPRPDVMADGVKCIECHATLSKGHSLAEVKKTCLECHEARYGKMTDEWQKEVSDRMRKLRSSIERLSSQRRMTSETERKKVETLTREVEEILKTLEKDRSKGVHNFIYARELLLKAEEQVLSAEKSLSKRWD